MSKSFLLGTIALVAMGFVACSEESRLGIKKPLIMTEYDSKSGEMYYSIQSQDDNTIIEDIIVNRWNCGSGVIKYQYVKEFFHPKYPQFEEISKEICPKHKDACINPFGEKGLFALLDKQGNKHSLNGIAYYNNPVSIYLYSNSKNDMDFYNNLHDDFKQFYKKVEPEKLIYGKTKRIWATGCGGFNNVLEVQLILNGGKKVTYDLSKGIGGQ